MCACSAVIQKEDDEGKVGVKIGKELMKVAGMALKVNITRLGPKVLPISEQLIFAGNFVLRKVPPLPMFQSILAVLQASKTWPWPQCPNVNCSSHMHLRTG